MKFILKTLLICCLLAACNSTSKIQNKELYQLEKLEDLLTKVRLDYKMPAMAAAVISSTEVKEIAVSGVRQIYQKDKVQLEDRFHLGSNTKAITAHWAAAMVESGQISWDTKMLEVFPHWEDDALKTYHEVTLSDLLCHRAKIQPFMSAYDLVKIPSFPGDAIDKRRAFAKWLVKQNPAKLGNKEGYEYSNAGYSVATAMLEKVSGIAWEDAIVNEVLLPMGANPVIGWPTDVNPEQPFGHHSVNPMDSNLRAVTKTNMYELPELLDPAGDISLSIVDYSKFVQAHLQGIRGQDNHLKASTYEYIHYGRPKYAMGWIQLEKDGVHISTHDGSAGTFYSSTILYKEKDLAIVVFVNASNMYATKAVYTLRKRLLELYDKES